MKLQNVLNDYRLLIFAGNGGTGKTTLSAAVAMEAAESGRNVGLITIDPSRRLGTAFGMDVLTENYKRKIVGNNFVDVFLIDSQKMIREFVSKNYSREFYEKLQANRLFNQISHALAENQSVSTIYQLAEMIESSEYDVIIVDTPPANHALDFFSSPRHVHRLFQENLVAKAVLEAKGMKFWSSKKIFIKVLSYLVGDEFVAEMETFFGALFSFQEHIVNSAKSLEATLKSNDACYFFVTLPEKQKIEEIADAIQSLREQDIHVRHMVVNRAFPEWLELDSPLDLAAAGRPVQIYYDKLREYYHNQRERLQGALNNMRDVAVYFIPEKSFFDESFSLDDVRATLRKVWS